MILLAPVPALAAPADLSPPVCAPGTLLGAAGDPLRVHVVSVTPGWTLMSSMGHTVLLFSGGPVDEPLAYNWGLFEATDQGLVWPFLRGTLPYRVEAVPWLAFWEDQVGQGRTVVAQRLDLEPAAAAALLAAAERAAAPENRGYRYHWGEANCATRVRDVLDEVTGGALRRALDRPVGTTPRIEGSRHLWRWPPIRFAWRFVTSDRMDVPLTAWERTMVPEHLMRELATVAVPGPGRAPRPLVGDTCTAHDGLFGWAPPRADPSPLGALPGAAVAIGALGATRRHDRRPRLAGAIVAGWGTLLASLGTASLALWAISDLDGFGPTENWLVAGPQSWLLAWAGVLTIRGRPISGGLHAACVGLAALGLGCVLLDLLPGVDQANGDVLLALLPGLLGCVVAVRRLRAGSSGSGPGSPAAR